MRCYNSFCKSINIQLVDKMLFDLLLKDLEGDLGGNTVGGDSVDGATARGPTDLLNDRGDSGVQVCDLI